MALFPEIYTPIKHTTDSVYISPDSMTIRIARLKLSLLRHAKNFLEPRSTFHILKIINAGERRLNGDNGEEKDEMYVHVAITFRARVMHSTDRINGVSWLTVRSVVLCRVNSMKHSKTSVTTNDPDQFQGREDTARNGLT